MVFSLGFSVDVPSTANDEKLLEAIKTCQTTLVKKGYDLKDFVLEIRPAPLNTEEAKTKYGVEYENYDLLVLKSPHRDCTVKVGPVVCGTR